MQIFQNPETAMLETLFTKAQTIHIQASCKKILYRKNTKPQKQVDVKGQNR